MTNDDTTLFDDAQPADDETVIAEAMVLRGDESDETAAMLGCDPFEPIDATAVPDDVSPLETVRVLDRETVVSSSDGGHD